ncbi:hypothetical protein [Actinoplanes sandaracinus]
MRGPSAVTETSVSAAAVSGFGGGDIHRRHGGRVPRHPRRLHRVSSARRAGSADSKSIGPLPNSGPYSAPSRVRT